MMGDASLPCCELTVGMWEFLQEPALCRGGARPSDPAGGCFDGGACRLPGASGEKGACEGGIPEPAEPVCMCWPLPPPPPPDVCLGGSSEECWEERPVGLLGGTDRSECWWWSAGWNASPYEHREHRNIELTTLTR